MLKTFKRACELCNGNPFLGLVTQLPMAWRKHVLKALFWFMPFNSSMCTKKAEDCFHNSFYWSSLCAGENCIVFLIAIFRLLEKKVYNAIQKAELSWHCYILGRRYKEVEQRVWKELELNFQCMKFQLTTQMAFAFSLCSMFPFCSFNVQEKKKGKKP